MLRLLSYTLVLMVGGGMAHAPSCSEPAHRRMQERFTACRSVHARAYHENSGKGGARRRIFSSFLPYFGICLQKCAKFGPFLHEK
jgi:hypothetical protein